MINLLHLVAAAAGGVIAVLCVIAWIAMNPNTKHCFRLVYGGLGVGGMALAALPLAGGYAWVREIAYVAMLVAFAIYLFLDRRGIGRSRSRGVA